MLPLKAIAFETGIEQEYIEQALERFEADGKIARSDGWIWVKNLRKYNASNSPTVQKRIERDLNDMPDGELKSAYIRYYMVSVPYDTVPIPPQEHEQETEQEQEHEQDIPPSAGADAPQTPPKALKKPGRPSQKAKPPPLTPGAQEFLRLFSAKRFSNNAQRDAILELERLYPESFCACAKWAAEKGVARGQAISMMRTALPDWGKKKKIKRGGDGRPPPDEPAGFAGLREVAQKHGIEIEGLTR